MTAVRAYLGERASCQACHQDIEFHGSRHGGWIDRGGNRFCPTKRQRILHRPFRPANKK